MSKHIDLEMSLPEDKITKLYIGSDHRGFNHKQNLIEFIKSKYSIDVIDIGCSNTNSCDYTDVAHNGANLTLQDPNARLILLCGSGTGMSIVANRYQGIRCAYGHKIIQVALARQHNNINALALGTNIEIMDLSDMRAMVQVFIETAFEELDTINNPSRHTIRVAKIDSDIITQQLDTQ